MSAGAAHTVQRIASNPFAGLAVLSPRTLCVRLVLASAVIALLCVCARLPGQRAGDLAIQTPFVPSTPAAPAPHPVPAARFDVAQPGSDPVRVTSRIDPRTGLREDVLTRGDIASIEAAALRVTLTRGARAAAAPTLFVLIARRAAGGPAVDGPALSVLRTSGRGQVLSKFGPVETLEVVFGGPVQRRCTGFVARDVAFRLDGWSCAPLGRPPEPEALACTLDALRLVDLADAETTEAFAVTSASAHACSPTTGVEAAGPTGSIAHRARNKK